jgi:hypothetical protein
MTGFDPNTLIQIELITIPQSIFSSSLESIQYVDPAYTKFIKYSQIIDPRRVFLSQHEGYRSS